MNAETSRTFRRDQKWRGSWKFQDRNRPKDSRPRFAPRPCRRMTVPKKITEPLKFTTMNDRVKEKAEKVKRKIDAGIDPDGRKDFGCIRQRPAACDARKTCRKRKSGPSGGFRQRESPAHQRFDAGDEIKSFRVRAENTDRHPKRISAPTRPVCKCRSRFATPQFMPDNRRHAAYHEHRPGAIRSAGRHFENETPQASVPSSLRTVFLKSSGE